MPNIKNLPESYKPYDELIICSNKLIDGGFLLLVGEQIPFLAGSGTIPQVWLDAVKAKSDGEFVSVVENSIPKMQSFRAVGDSNSLEILLGSLPIVKISQESSLKIAKIEKLDLRPLGFAIFGDDSGLTVGESRFRNNNFSKVHAMISIATESDPPKGKIHPLAK